MLNKSKTRSKDLTAPKMEIHANSYFIIVAIFLRFYDKFYSEKILFQHKNSANIAKNT